MQRIKLKIAYDGTAYHGWQVQNDCVSIQSTLQDALAKILGETVKVYASGRTDAGVHALEQVGLIEINREIPLYNLHAGVNSLLPKDIVVTDMEEAAADFHPRFSAKGKRYRYTIRNSTVRDVFEGKYHWLVYQSLDLEAMNKAAGKFIGTHDFSSFRSSGCCNEDAVKTITEATCVKKEEMISFDITGSGFLKQMVRAIAGTLVEVGKGKIQPEEIEGIIAAKNRCRAGQTAPSQGLCLMKVFY